MVEVIYFDNDEYLKIKGVVSKIDYVYLELMIVQTKIKFDDIYKIKIVNEAI